MPTSKYRDNQNTSQPNRPLLRRHRRWRHLGYKDHIDHTPTLRERSRGLQSIQHPSQYRSMGTNNNFIKHWEKSHWVSPTTVIKIKQLMFQLPGSEGKTTKYRLLTHRWYFRGCTLSSTTWRYLTTYYEYSLNYVQNMSWSSQGCPVIWEPIVWGKHFSKKVISPKLNRVCIQDTKCALIHKSVILSTYRWTFSITRVLYLELTAINRVLSFRQRIRESHSIKKFSLIRILGLSGNSGLWRPLYLPVKPIAGSLSQLGNGSLFSGYWWLIIVIIFFLCLDWCLSLHPYVHGRSLAYLQPECR